MISFLLIGFSCLFFLLGHSTLLYFREKDSETIPIADVIFPWPKNGKFVSLLCLALSFSSFILMLLLTSDTNPTKIYSKWKILISLGIFPMVFYLIFICRRITKNSKGSLCFKSEVINDEWSLPILFSSCIAFIFWIFNKI